MKRPYYIFSPGRLKRKQNTIFMDQFAIPPPETAEETDKHEDEIISLFEEEEVASQVKPIPVEDIEAFYIFAQINFNTSFLNFLAKHKIPAHVFNYYGGYSGTYYPREYLISGYLLVNQVEHYRSKKLRMIIARSFIDAASFNILKNLKYYNNRERDLQALIDDIEGYRAQIGTTETPYDLMAVEGHIRERYYRAWNQIIVPSENGFDFERRTKQPPQNAVNALVSFGNMIMYTAVLTEIYRTQLHPAISFLHEPSERRFSLSLDIAEIFKPIFVDRIIFKLINNNEIQEKHFQKELNYCYLKEGGRRIFVKEFDEKLKTTIRHRNLERDVSYRRLIRLELYRLIRHLTGIEIYEGFKIWW
jgi:CRISPR-associated protein Cas1